MCTSGCRTRSLGQRSTRTPTRPALPPNVLPRSAPMVEESTTPDPVELSRRFHEAASRLDFDAMLSFYAPDAVWEGRASGMTFEGRTAIRGFWKDFAAAYEEFEFAREETLDLGNGVIF